MRRLLALLLFCGSLFAQTGTNTQTQSVPGSGGGGGAVSSVFGRTGAVSAAANDYTLAQIAGITCAGDLTGTLPNCTVTQVNGAVVPASAKLLGSNASSQDIAAALTSAHFYVGNGSNLPADVAMSGDCSLANTGGITCTKTNGSAFAASATTDTTVATNISSGTLPAGRLPATAVQTNQANTYSTGAQDFTSATSILVPTQTAGDSSTKGASTAFVTTAIANAVAGVNPAVAVLAASTATITGTYTSVGSGIGDTFTVTATGAFTLDGIAINTIGQRVLLKNQTDGTQNGIYFASIPGSLGVSPVFTRALDYDQPSDVNNTGAIPVQSGTANTTTSWLLTSNIASIGPAGSAFTYAQFSYNPSAVALLASPTFTGTVTANNLTVNGTCTGCGSGSTGLSGMTATQVPIAATASTVTSSKALAGSGTGIVTGPTTSVSGDIVTYTGTGGQTQDSGILPVCIQHQHPIAGASDQLSAAGTFATTASVTSSCMAAGTMIVVRAHGVFTTTGTASPKVAFQVNAGNTSAICPAPATAGAPTTNLTNAQWDVFCYIQINTTGTPGTAVAWGNWYLTSSTSLDSIAGTGNFGFSNQSTGTVSYTTSATETVSIQETGTLVSGQTFNLTALDVIVQQ